MSKLELSGNLNISVKNQQVPVNFYDNIIELHINNFKVLYEFLIPGFINLYYIVYLD